MRIPNFHALWFGIFCILAVSAPSLAEDKASFAPVVEDIVSQGFEARYFSLCPSKIFRRDSDRESLRLSEFGIQPDKCAASPSYCWSLCKLERNNDACMQLGFAMQTSAVDERMSEVVFAMACAAGAPSGCTNRAAGIRNGGFASNPFARSQSQRRENCLFMSFRAACNAGDAWGCAMLGQAFELGEGTRRSLALARRNYRKSCKILTYFPSCDFAKAGLERIARKSNRN